MTAPKCHATAKNGTPCNAYAGTDSDYCYQHDPGRAAERHLARSKGGHARHGRRIGTVNPPTETPPIDLETMADVAALLQRTIGDTLRLENSIRRARTVGYLAGLLIKALESAELEDRIARIEFVLQSRENGP